MARPSTCPRTASRLPRYEEARAEVLAKGGTVAGYSTVADADEAAPTRRRSFWATLFGGSDEDEDAEEIRATSRPGRNLLAGRQNGSPQEYYASDSNSSVYAALQQAEAPPPARQLTRAAVVPQPQSSTARTRRRRRGRPGAARGHRFAAAPASDPDRRPAADRRDRHRAVAVLAAGTGRPGRGILARCGVRAHAAAAPG